VSQDLDLQILLDGVWTSIDAFSKRPVQIQRGLAADADWPGITRVAAELDNRDLSLDPSHPESVLYGLAGRNTLVRVRMGTTNRTWAEATSWRPTRTIDHIPGGVRGRAAVDLTAEGVLGRISRWTEELRSPMYRTISARPTSLGHWSFEDGRDATSVSNSLAGAPAGQFTGDVTLGGDEAPLGASSSLQIGSGSRVFGRFRSASTTAGWQVSFAYYLPNITTATYYEVVSWRATNGWTWRWSTNNANYSIDIVNDAGSTIVSVQQGHGGAGPADWVTVKVKASVSGGTVTYEPSWYRQGETAVGYTDTVSGTVGALTSWIIDANAGNENGFVSHLFGVTGGTDSLDNDTARAVFNGYRGEAGYNRFARLCGEVGVTAYQIGGDPGTQLMGPQTADTPIALLREIVDTDDLMISDTTGDVAVTIRARRSLLDQTPALALTFGVDVAGFEKLIGAQGVTNIVTLSNRTGGDYTLALESGPMSTAPSPDGIGEERQRVDVNVADEGSQLPDLAGWHLAKGTLDGPRYTQVTVNLVANPEHETACQGMRLGDVISIDAIEPDPVMLLVVGFTEIVGHDSRVFVFDTEPYAPYQAGRYDDSRFRYDVAHSTLATGRDTTQTSWAVTGPTLSDTWSTTAVPYDVFAGGERLTVTAATSPAGSGPFTQTLTVTRSVNGIVKSHLAGTSIRVATPGRYAL
jgi:hypothetical protein